jgi:hypothetical protein
VHVVTQQQLAQAVPRAHQIPAHVLTCSDQIAQRLLIDTGRPHRVQATDGDTHLPSAVDACPLAAPPVESITSAAEAAGRRLGDVRPGGRPGERLSHVV